MPLPSQLRLTDGFSTTISFDNIPGVKLFETDVTPPGYTNGTAIDTTTMRNTAYRTMAPRKLKNLTVMTAVVSYATEAFEDIWPQIGINQYVRVTFPDQTQVQFWGWIEEFTPAAHKEGTMPTATLKVQPGMRDPNGNEVPPVYFEPSEESSAP